MKRIISVFCLLTVFYLLIFSTYANAQTVSVIYSSYSNGGYFYKNTYKEPFNNAGLKCEEYENTALDSLNYNVDCIIFSTVGNYENTRPLENYPFKKFVEDGGVLIITDANYPSVVDFLPKTFGLVFRNEAGGDNLNAESEKARPYLIHHPLLAGVKVPTINWGIFNDISPEFTPLYVDLKDRPIIAYAEIGKGLLIVGGPKYDNRFASAQFVKNAINYVKSDRRDIPKELVSLNLEKYAEFTKQLTPISGTNTDLTQCTIKYDENKISFDFLCNDYDLIFKTTDKTKRDDDLSGDDSVEVYIENNGDIYKFAINTNNIQSDSKNGNSGYDTYWTSSVSSQGDCWKANISLPFSAIGMSPDKEPRLKVNIFRNFHVGKKDETLYSLVKMFSDKVGNPNYWQEIYLASDNDYSDLKYDLSLDAKEEYKYGQNIIKLNEDITFDIINITTKETFKGVKGECDVNLTTVGDNQIMGVAYVGEKVIGSTPIYIIKVNEILTLDVIYPRYRDQVMSKDPNKTLRLNVSSPEKLTVDFALTRDSRKIFSKKYILIPGKTTLISYDLKKLSVGDYKYILKVSDKAGKTIGNIEKSFKVLPPNNVEITFDEKQICYINGEPVFPIMLYHSGGNMLRHLNGLKKDNTPELYEAKIIEELKERGFTTGHAQVYDIGIVDRYKEAGLNIVSEIGDQRDRAKLQEYINAYNKNENGLFYYTIDEPFDEKLEHDIEIYNILKEMDPYRPCGGAVCFAPVFKEAVKCFDVMMPDAYEITRQNPEPSFSGLFRLMGPANEYGKKNGKALWAVPQAFGWKNFSHWIMPTCEQMKCQAFFYIVYGATGLCWYAFASPEKDRDTPYNAFCIYDYPEQWNYFKELNQEVTDFAQVLFKGESQGPLGVNDKVHSNVWKVGKKNYAVIVNGEPTAETVTYEMKGKIKPFFNKYTYNFVEEAGKVTFNLKPYECVIVEY